MKRRNEETKKPRNQESKNPRNQETKQPRKQEIGNLATFDTFYFQQRESLPPLNIPTPTPAPAALLGDTRELGGHEVHFYLKIRAQERQKAQ